MTDTTDNDLDTICSESARKNNVHLRLVKNAADKDARDRQGDSVQRTGGRQNNAPSTTDAFVILRLHDFDILEETFGHAVARELNRLVCERLRGCLRAVDVLERISANEFALMLADIGSQKQLETLVARIVERCSGEYVCADLRLDIRVTAGVSIVPQYSSLFEEQLRYARIALRKTGENFHSSVQFFTPDLLHDLQDRAAMLFELRQALKQRRFVLHYQPQYRVDSKETIAVESLLRLQTHDGELVFPDRFIDLAEESGLMLPIGHWVIQEACRQFREWQDNGCALQHIAVNVSTKQLIDNSLIEIVDAAVQDAGIDYCNLELEITEQSLISQISMAKDVLHELSAKGVRIALDDFGTGYSSLAYLAQLPLNVLKIDRSFLQQLDHDKRSAGLIRSVFYIARELDLEVLAEGVENQSQQLFIQSASCHMGQGYGYCRPQTAENMTSMLLQPAIPACM